MAKRLDWDRVNKEKQSHQGAVGKDGPVGPVWLDDVPKEARAEARKEKPQRKKHGGRRQLVECPKCKALVRLSQLPDHERTLHR